MEVAMEVLAGHLFTCLCVAAMQFFVGGCGQTVVLAIFCVWVWVGAEPRDILSVSSRLFGCACRWALILATSVCGQAPMEL